MAQGLDQISKQKGLIMNFKTILAAAALLFTAQVAHAQNTTRLQGIYLGANVGTTFLDRSDVTLGAVAGYQFSPVWGAEVTYDYLRFNSASPFRNAQQVFVNGTYGRPVAGVTPYVLAGVGLGWNNLGTNSTGDAQALYNVGAGVRVPVTARVDVDARYRYLGTFNNNQNLPNAHVVTVGARLRF
jgi:opacity protein-like surface antigen